MSFETCFRQNPGKEAACCEGAPRDETKKQQGQATAFYVSEGKLIAYFLLAARAGSREDEANPELARFLISVF